MNITRFRTPITRVSARTALGCLLAAGAALAVTIGPDSFGYLANDATPYSFLDVSATGVALLAGADDDHALVNIGFPFLFYGRPYTSLCVSSNGLLSFDGCNPDFANQDLSATKPSGDYPTIAPFWSDLSFAAPGAGAVYYQTLGLPPNRQFVVQWHNAFPLNASKGVTFQTILHEAAGKILFQYLDVNAGPGAPASSGAAATVAIRDSAGQLNGRSLQWSFKAPVLHDAQAILFVPDAVPPVITGMPDPGCQLWPPNNKLVTVATVEATDPGTGIASFSVTATSNEPPGKEPDIVITPSGNQYVVELRAKYTDFKDPDYWRKYPDTWPVQTLTLAGVAYSKDQLLKILNTPAKGNAGYELAYELIAAKLNYVTNPDPAILKTIDTADAWLQAHPLDGKLPVAEADKKTALDLTKALETYRKAIGTARVYTITATAKDAAGNTSTATAQCAVPHDKGK